MSRLDNPANQMIAFMDKYGDEAPEAVLDTWKAFEIYAMAREGGATPRAAEMYAMQSPPGANTDDNWWRGNQHFSKRMGEEYAQRLRTKMALQGVEMSPWDDYDPGSAKYFGDPDALISGHGSPRERLARAQRLMLMDKARKEAAPRIDLAEDIIKQKFYDRAKENPELLKAPRSEKLKIRKEIIEKHAYKPAQG